MIPKKIHYCWFGNNPLDEKALRCIESWRKYFPDYEIIRWNENNCNIHESAFMEKAYHAQKWAFVSDVARLQIIYQYGGIYFDTDVEVVASYDDILQECTHGFMGMDNQRYINSGLGFGAEKNSPVIKGLLDIYNQIDFDDFADDLPSIACPVLTNAYFKDKGFWVNGTKQVLLGLDIYPHDYFNPLDYQTGKVKITKNTHSIHWYSDSWNSIENQKAKKTLQKYRRIMGLKYGDIIYGIVSSVSREGIISYIAKRLRK